MKQYNTQTFIHQLLSTLAKNSTANQEATQNIVNNWGTLHTHTFYPFNLPISSNSQIKTESNGNAIHSQCFHFICKFKPFLNIQYVHKLISTLTPPPQSIEWYCVTDMALPPSSAQQGNGDSSLSLHLATGSLKQSQVFRFSLLILLPGNNQYSFRSQLCCTYMKKLIKWQVHIQ